MRAEDKSKGFTKKILLLIIISILFLSATQILSSQNETIQSDTISVQADKAQYQIGETVKVIVNVPDITN